MDEEVFSVYSALMNQCRWRQNCTSRFYKLVGSPAKLVVRNRKQINIAITAAVKVKPTVPERVSFADNLLMKMPLNIKA